MTQNINLDTLTTDQGVKIVGENIIGCAGYSVSNAGDINGDGYADAIISAPFIKSSTGKSYLIFGDKNILNLNLSSITLSQGFSIEGESVNDLSGYSVSSAGDVNGDGNDDIVIGARNASPDMIIEAGTSYVLFGKTGGFSNIKLRNITTAEGFKIYGAGSDDWSGFSVSEIGNFNGDDFGDIIISETGNSHVIFGKANGFTDIYLANLTPTIGFTIHGDYSGWSVNAVGDINKDGFDDVVIGAQGLNSESGAAYVIFGNSSTNDIYLDTDLTVKNQGFSIYGALKSQTGFSVSGAGDINNDGYDDLIIGAPVLNFNSGAAYIIFGNKSLNNIYLNLDLDLTTTKQGFTFYGNNQSKTGYSVSNAGDVNRDGISDIIVGAPYENFGAGISYVLFGKKNGYSNIQSKNLKVEEGFKIFGTSSVGNSGFSVGGGGDINGDGYDDVIIGAPNYAYPNGAAYIVFGENSAAQIPTLSPTTMPTSTPTEAYINVDITTGGTYAGTSAKENFVVDSSQDTTITGSGGADMFTIMVHPGVNTTVTDFNEIDELINLVAFTNIHSIDDFTITSGSAIINLDDQQKVILQNLSPSDLTSNNFVFAAVSGDTGNANDNYELIIGSVIGGVVMLGITGCAVYAYTHNIWPFVGETLLDKGIEIGGSSA